MTAQKEKIESISNMLQKGLNDLFSSEQYLNYLKMVSRFPNYSYRNILLLLRQCPNATMVRGFRSWMKFGRRVKAGERGLRIIAPYVKEQKKQKDKQVDEDVDEFRRISVFDISQTEPLSGMPEMLDAPTPPVQMIASPFAPPLLEGEVENFSELQKALCKIAPFSVIIEPISDRKKGYCDYANRRIVVKRGLSQIHTIKTTLHEIAHALLHEYVSNKDRKEIEVESIAFTVCQYYGLDTSGYSFSYIAGYSMGKEKKELKDFLNTIQRTASYLIDSIDGEMEASKISYDTSELTLIVNQKTITRLWSQGFTVYLVYPGKGELFTSSSEDIKAHTGPFAAPRDIWQDRDRIAA